MIAIEAERAPSLANCRCCQAGRAFSWARGLCRRCYRQHGGLAPAGGRRRGTRQGRQGAEAAKQELRHTATGRPSRVRPAERPCCWGYSLLTLHDADEEDRERARRVEIYAEQFERLGRLDFENVPPAPLPSPATAATPRLWENGLERPEEE